MSLTVLDMSILGPAMLAGLLVLATHVPLGREVLARGIVFIDLAIAQIAGLGVIAADSFGWEPQGWGVQAAALSAAAIGAIGLTWTEKRWPESQEALIGVLFVLAACAGLILMAGNPHGAEHLKDLLVGQILWVSTAQLQVTAGVTAGLLLARHWLGGRLGRVGFYLIFACAITLSVQLVGVYLVFASLIIPALAVRSMTGRTTLAIAYGIGAGGYALGLAASAWYDIPSGAVIVWAIALMALLSRFVVPKQ
ncbi:zinc/manganese transporter permease [Sulfuriferula sp. AH1]|uniref:metal ABC transporter permease n=1 Tax=Sulfuriferula sp. AH1 TaxID=1985873 RepID=UPI000B3B4B5F|nr:metal ABC transporter permease [Sulfuriferula sp. AH1]ARU32545.1 zinc/manganese transporter permease [Sulfuriferula sp. AH1]